MKRRFVQFFLRAGFQSLPPTTGPPGRLIDKAVVLEATLLGLLISDTEPLMTMQIRAVRSPLGWCQQKRLIF